MIIRFLFFILLIITLNYNILSRDDKSEGKFYDGVYLEYNTLILITNNLKLYSDLNYYENDKIILSLQPGAEFLYSISKYLPGSPFYELNLLQSIDLFPNYGISIIPFAGLSSRIRTENNNASTLFYLKYGSTLQLNISQYFKIIGKIMNLPKNNSGDVPVLLGIGFSIKLF